jgi:hypothetical protein
LSASDAWSTLPNRAVNWDQVLTQAQGVLAPAQLKALQALRLRAEFDARRSAVLFREAQP